MTRPQPVTPAVEVILLPRASVQALVDRITADIERCDAMSAFPGYANEAAAYRNVLATLAGLCLGARNAQ